MRLFAIAALAALQAGAGLAQAPAAAPPARPAPAPARPPAAAPPQVPTRVSARTLTTLCGQDRGACLTYILGSADAYAGALTASGRPQVVCFPRGTTNDQIALAAVRYLRAHPEEGNNNASLVVFAGLQAAFPCGY